MSEPTTWQAVSELAASGLLASDGFAGLRALVRAARDKRPVAERDLQFAGRWSLLQRTSGEDDSRTTELRARALLRRYGIVFRRLLTREASAPPWRALVSIYRRLEARGEIRGGRFVTGMSGEQFALPEAVDRLRQVRRSPHDDQNIAVSGVDPLNLAGIITSGDRVRATMSNRIVYRNGVPLAALEGEQVRPLAPSPPGLDEEAVKALVGRRLPVPNGGYVGRTSL
jgi:ATP-dependent Lhr-like helicase